MVGRFLGIPRTLWNTALPARLPLLCFNNSIQSNSCTFLCHFQNQSTHTQRLISENWREPIYLHSKEAIAYAIELATAGGHLSLCSPYASCKDSLFGQIWVRLLFILFSTLGSVLGPPSPVLARILLDQFSQTLTLDIWSNSSSPILNSLASKSAVSKNLPGLSVFT